ncbi:helix-turn-helix domain-containing protein [Nonomuraea sp. NPDC050680]|uniref:helix-turn-helix domain-containing protein n=1 Tax=Nonomuraea sp. NPDC050680 TaxID=3154630 RepID=UPI0033F11391
MRRTRSAILDATARVLGRRSDAAMAEIADEAGVGRATLYRHFPRCARHRPRPQRLTAVSHSMRDSFSGLRTA